MFYLIYLFQVFFFSELRKFVTIAIPNIEKEHFNELRETGWLSSAVDHDGEGGLSHVPLFLFFQPLTARDRVREGTEAGCRLHGPA